MLRLLPPPRHRMDHQVSTRLTTEQGEQLSQLLDPSHVHECADGLDRVSHAYVRATLIRIFGHGGYDTTTTELAGIEQYAITNDPERMWFVSYRAQVRLTVKTLTGDRLGTWDGAAAGASINTTKTHAHDHAMKFALSRALVHAAINLGSQFGLDLYHKDPVELPNLIKEQ